MKKFFAFLILSLITIYSFSQVSEVTIYRFLNHNILYPEQWSGQGSQPDLPISILNTSYYDVRFKNNLLN